MWGFGVSRENFRPVLAYLPGQPTGEGRRCPGICRHSVVYEHQLTIFEGLSFDVVVIILIPLCGISVEIILYSGLLCWRICFVQAGLKCLVVSDNGSVR